MTVWLEPTISNISISGSNQVERFDSRLSALCTGCGQMTPRRVTAGICHHPLMKVCSKPGLCIGTHFELIGSAKNARRETPIDSPINKTDILGSQYHSCIDTQSRFAAHFHQRMVADSGSHAPGCYLTTLCGNTKVHLDGN